MKKISEKISKTFKTEEKPFFFGALISIAWAIIISFDKFKESFVDGFLYWIELIFIAFFVMGILAVVVAIALAVWETQLKDKNEVFNRTILIAIVFCCIFSYLDNDMRKDKFNSDHIKTYVDSNIYYQNVDIEMEDYFNEYKEPESYYVPNYINFLREQLVEKTDKRLIIVNDTIEYNGMTIYLDDIYDPYDDNYYVDLTKVFNYLSEN